MRKLLAFVAVAVTVLALALTACGPAQGPAGTVVDKDRTYWSATKQWTYKLTTRDSAGSHKFRVSRSVYHSCYRGSAYPKCANR